MMEVIQPDGEILFRVVKREPNEFIRFKSGGVADSKDILAKFNEEYDKEHVEQFSEKTYKFKRNSAVTKRMGSLWTALKNEQKRTEIDKEWPKLVQYYMEKQTQQTKKEN